MCEWIGMTFIFIMTIALSACGQRNRNPYMNDGSTGHYRSIE
ncbi:hypothetical protein JPSP7_16350 [Staphylococcus pseudintermedius]